jgi:hypothetical protein
LEGADCRGKKGSVGEGDEFAWLGALVDGDVGGMVAGDRDGPQTSDGIAVAGQDGVGIMVDGDSGGIESGGATGIAELANRKEGSVGEGGEEVSNARRGW